MYKLISGNPNRILNILVFCLSDNMVLKESNALQKSKIQYKQYNKNIGMEV